MAGFIGDRRVASGVWWNDSSFEVRVVPAEGGTLPDTNEDWHRVPVWLLAPLAPVVGGVCLVLLPVVGAAVLAGGVVRRALSGGRRMALDLSNLLTVSPATGEAHLTGKPEGAGAGQAPAQRERDGMDELEAEIKDRQEKVARGE